MGRYLRIIGIIAAIAAVAIWLALGAHTGWTQTSVAVKKTDPVTEIEYDEWQDRFVPGVDFLGATLLGSGLLIGFSFLLPGAKLKNSKTE